MPARKELPGTLERSPAKARRTGVAAHHGAHRTAMAALEHTFEKVGNPWRRKRRKGPQAARGRPAARRAPREPYGGVDFLGHTKAELLGFARRLDVRGRSRMSKAELARARWRVCAESQANDPIRRR